MTFCSQCGVECVANAKFCHSCGCEISQQKPRNATATSSANSTPSTSGSTLTHINCNRSRLSFGAYRIRKEVERSSCFKPKGSNPVNVDLSHKYGNNLHLLHIRYHKRRNSSKFKRLYSQTMMESQTVYMFTCELQVVSIHQTKITLSVFSFKNRIGEIFL